MLMPRRLPWWRRRRRQCGWTAFSATILLLLCLASLTPITATARVPDDLESDRLLASRWRTDPRDDYLYDYDDDDDDTDSLSTSSNTAGLMDHTTTTTAPIDSRMNDHERHSGDASSSVDYSESTMSGNTARVHRMVTSMMDRLRDRYRQRTAVTSVGNDDDDAYAVPHNKAGRRLTRSRRLARQVTVPLVPHGPLTINEAQISTLRSDEDKVKDQIKTGVSLILSNNFLHMAKDFLIGIMFKENSGQNSHGSEVDLSSMGASSRGMASGSSSGGSSIGSDDEGLTSGSDDELEDTASSAHRVPTTESTTRRVRFAEDTIDYTGNRRSTRDSSAMHRTASQFSTRSSGSAFGHGESAMQDSLRGQWPVILDLVVPTELKEFTILNNGNFRIAARAENLVISDMTEPDDVVVKVDNGVDLNIQVTGLDFKIRVDTTLRVKIPGFAEREFPARFQADFRDVQFSATLDPKFVDDPANPRGPRIFQPVIRHENVAIIIGDGSRMNYGLFSLSGYLFNRVSRAVLHTNNVLQKILTRNLIAELVKVITEQTIPARLQQSITEIVSKILESLDSVMQSYNIDMTFFQKISFNNQHIRLAHFPQDRVGSRIVLSYDWHLTDVDDQHMSPEEFTQLFSHRRNPPRSVRREIFGKALDSNMNEDPDYTPRQGLLARLWNRLRYFFAWRRLRENPDSVPLTRSVSERKQRQLERIWAKMRPSEKINLRQCLRKWWPWCSKMSTEEKTSRPSWWSRTWSWPKRAWRKVKGLFSRKKKEQDAGGVVDEKNGGDEMESGVPVDEDEVFFDSPEDFDGDEEERSSRTDPIARPSPFAASVIAEEDIVPVKRGYWQCLEEVCRFVATRPRPTTTTAAAATTAGHTLHRRSFLPSDVPAGAPLSVPQDTPLLAIQVDYDAVSKL